jgi:hypothetical protein
MAAAMALPRWAVNAGLIQFIGLEADDLLLRIGRLNCQWHTLKGWYLDPADLPFVFAMDPDFIISDIGVVDAPDEPSAYPHEAE